jgi:hypothetical protein
VRQPTARTSPDRPGEVFASLADAAHRRQSGAGVLDNRIGFAGVAGPVRPEDSFELAPADGGSEWRVFAV